MELSADTATWVAVGVAAAAAMIVLMLLLVVGARRRAAQELAQATVEEVRRYVEGALERQAGPSDFRQPDARLRRLREVSLTIEVDEVLERALRATTELSGAAAAMILFDLDGERLVRTVGLTPTEANSQRLGIPPGYPEARALEIEYRYSDEQSVNDHFRLRRGLSVPLVSTGGEPVGAIVVFWRRSDRVLSDDDVAFLEEVADIVAPAARNAQQLVAAREAAQTDETTGLPNRRFFVDALRRECARARRYNHRLTLLVLEANGSPAPPGSSLAAAADQLTANIRASDVASRLGPGKFAVLLPETALEDATVVHRRIVPSVQASVGVVRTGFAELGAGDDPFSLLERAETATASVSAPGRV